MASHCQICGAACEECERRRAEKTRQHCACGCGKLLGGKRWHARYASEQCRYRVRNKRRQNARIAAE